MHGSSKTNIYVDGNGKQVYKQLYGALFVIAWNIVWTSLIMCFIKYVLRIPLRMTDEQLMAGDDAIHGEVAYVIASCEAHEHLLAGQYSKKDETQPGHGIMVGRDPADSPPMKVDEGKVGEKINRVGSGSGSGSGDKQD